MESKYLVDNRHLGCKIDHCLYKMLKCCISDCIEAQSNLGSIPFPVTVMGVTVVEARGAKTGVPAVATDERAAAKRLYIEDCFIFELIVVDEISNAFPEEHLGVK